MNIPGDRPNAEPVDHGEWQPERAYLIGDTVTYRDQTWRCIADQRAGLLPPPAVATDRPGEFWKSVLASSDQPR